MLKNIIDTMKQRRKLRRFLKKNPINVKEIPPVYEWSKEDYCAPSPTFVKKRVLLRLISSGQHFIETGTFKGKTAQAMSRAGHTVTTIEVYKPLFDLANSWLTEEGVECILGDSSLVFQELLPRYREKDIFFWLDGHYSGTSTGKGEQDTPIVKELEHIKSILLPSEARITIAIDDFRLFPNGETPTEYPTRNFLVDWARDNGLSWNVEHDIFVLKNWHES
ncbi:O-methyltransferase [Roseibium sp. M-1]